MLSDKGPSSDLQQDEKPMEGKGTFTIKFVKRLKGLLWSLKLCTVYLCKSHEVGVAGNVCVFIGGGTQVELCGSDLLRFALSKTFSSH